MPQRAIKIILPRSKEVQVIEMLNALTHLGYWFEESSSYNVVVSILAESDQSEVIMDLFEKEFSLVEGFRLILFPVEASLPRVKKIKEPEQQSEDEKPKINGFFSRISREELYADVKEGSVLSRFYMLMVFLSTIVVAVGLLKNSVAVIIGGMVIAPFLGPNVGLALSNCLADKDLRKTANKSLLVGISFVLLLSFFIGIFFDVDASLSEIASRTRPDLGDIILALAAGSAGVFAFTSGASSAVIGVMVAVALLPPLVVCGLLMGSGAVHEGFGAFLLFLVNVICINLAGIGTFLLQGVSPRLWWEADLAKRSSRKAFITWSLTLAILTIILLLWKAYY